MRIDSRSRRKVCLYCRQEFVVAAKHWRSQMYCSRLCFAKAETIPEETRHCETCGTPFECRETSRRRFCTKACAYAGRRKPPGTATCSLCGKVFQYTIRPSRKPKFCSRKCAANHLRVPRKTPRKEYKYERTWSPIEDRMVVVHRAVAAEKLGRRLRPEERVHHIDMDARNNAPENLHVYESNTAHRQAHSDLEMLVGELYRAGILGFVDGKYTPQRRLFQ